MHPNCSDPMRAPIATARLLAKAAAGSRSSCQGDEARRDFRELRGRLLENREALRVLFLRDEIPGLTDHDHNFLVVGRSGDDGVIEGRTRARVVVLARKKIRLEHQRLDVARVYCKDSRNRLQRHRNVILLRVGRRYLKEGRRILRIQGVGGFKLRPRIVEVLLGRIDAAQRRERARIRLVEGHRAPGDALGVGRTICADIDIGELREHAKVRRIEVRGLFQVIRRARVVAELLFCKTVIVIDLRGFVAHLQQVLRVLQRDVRAADL